MKKVHCVLLLSLLLGGCFFKPDVTVSIQDVRWKCENIPFSYWPSLFSSASAFTSMEILFDQKNLQVDDLYKIRITAPNGSYWEWDEDQIRKEFDASRRTFTANRMWVENLGHQLDLGKWDVEVTSSTGAKDYATIEITAPGQDAPNEKRYCYTEDSRQIPTSSYTPALQRATDVVAQVNDTNLEVRFRVNDNNVYSGVIDVFDDQDRYLSSSSSFLNFDTNSIQPFLNGGSGIFDRTGTNTCTLTAQNFLDDIELSDIEYIHVVLFDGAQHTAPYRFSHLSISEKITLP
ncbi:MAG: DUF4249 family protein [Spirochaetales bacterium]|nr:DUF4249 family protein [Spirochaetales bacterium]